MGYFLCGTFILDEGVVDTSTLGAEERNDLFAKGMSHERKGKCEAALKCYLKCLRGLSQETRFVLLPQCLRNVSKIFSVFVWLCHHVF